MADHSDWQSTRWMLSFLSPLSPPPELPEGPDQWRGILAAADRGLVLPRLALAARQCASGVPAEVREYLDLSLELCNLRDAQLRGQLKTLLAQMNARGVTPVVMKGATALLDAGGRPTGRVMLDIDLAVPEAADHAAAFSALAALGYEASGPLAIDPAHHHFPSFFRDGALARIELHYRLSKDGEEAGWDEAGACSRFETHHLADCRFRTLSLADGLRLSYLQCRRGIDEGAVIIMKWLDFLDRWQACHGAPVSDLRDLGFGIAGGPRDRQLLTALSALAGLPYAGRRDDSLLATWQSAYADPVALRLFKEIFRNAFAPERWRGKSPAEIARKIGGRVTGLRGSLHRARNRDTF